MTPAVASAPGQRPQADHHAAVHSILDRADFGHRPAAAVLKRRSSGGCERSARRRIDAEGPARPGNRRPRKPRITQGASAKAPATAREKKPGRVRPLWTPPASCWRQSGSESNYNQHRLLGKPGLEDGQELGHKMMAPTRAAAMAATSTAPAAVSFTSLARGSTWGISCPPRFPGRC